MIINNDKHVHVYTACTCIHVIYSVCIQCQENVIIILRNSINLYTVEPFYCRHQKAIFGTPESYFWDSRKCPVNNRGVLIREIP